MDETTTRSGEPGGSGSSDSVNNSAPAHVDSGNAPPAAVGGLTRQRRRYRDRAVGKAVETCQRAGLAVAPLDQIQGVAVRYAELGFDTAFALLECGGYVECEIKIGEDEPEA